jgi:hypothetical protein
LAPREDDLLALFRPDDFRPADFRPADLRPADFRPADLRPVDFRPPDREADFRVLFRAELRPLRLADLVLRLADRPALFLAPLRADFFAPRLAVRVELFFRDPPPERALPPDLERPPEPERLELSPDSPRRLLEGSSKSKDEGVDAGEGEGLLSEGRGSIHPEPDQPISI